MEIKNKVCNHDIVTKFGVAECQNCGIEESEILKDKLKQETLDEAAKRLYGKGGDLATSSARNRFIEGAKYQAEQMYSEEEVKKLSLNFFYYWWNSIGTNTEEGFDRWFKQFKKIT